MPNSTTPPAFSRAVEHWGFIILLAGETVIQRELRCGKRKCSSLKENSPTSAGRLNVDSGTMAIVLEFGAGENAVFRPL